MQENNEVMNVGQVLLDYTNNDKILYDSIGFDHDYLGVLTEVEFFYKVKNFQYKALSWEITRSEAAKEALSNLSADNYFIYTEDFYRILNQYMENLESN